MHSKLVLLATLLIGCAALAEAGGEEPVLQPRPGNPIVGLDQDALDRFHDGQSAFETVITEDQGLGPIFNGDSCSSCHSEGGVGGSSATTVTRFGARAAGQFDPLSDIGGSLLQSQAIDAECLEEVPAEANVVVQRITTPLFGAGLIEAIEDADLEALASDGLVTSGRVHWVVPVESATGDLRAGRFGWKSQIATLHSFSAEAASNELGLTSDLFPTENAPNGDLTALSKFDAVADPEIVADDTGLDFIERVVRFQRYLAPPPQTPKSGMAGEQIFIDIGCSDCHYAPGFVTGEVGDPALSGVAIKPYSNFLLHDMIGLGDGIVQGDATGREMRTTPLWGLRLRSAFLHHGRVDDGYFELRVYNAMLSHKGEGEESYYAFLALAQEEQEQLLAFLGSLGRAEFDHDGDNFIGEADLAEFVACLRGAGGYDPDHPCAVSDVDQDGDCDEADADLFLVAYEGALEDCDDDGVADLEELLFGVLDGSLVDCNDNLRIDACESDEDGNGIPDECQTFVRGDLDGDLRLGITDPLRLLGYLFLAGAAPGCADAGDADDDGHLNIADGLVTLRHLFVGGMGPAAPYPECGPDPTGEERLGCESPASCR